MNFNSQDINEVVALGGESGLKIEFIENLLTLEKTRSRLGYIYWLLLIISFPVYHLFYGSSTMGFFIACGMSLGFVYLIYDSLSATNKLIVDLANEELCVVSNNSVLRKAKMIPFDEIRNITLAEKSFGRGQSVGRRLFVQTTEGINITAIDIRKSETAEIIEHLLNGIIKG